jgi:excisionase family DNA binding protein
MLHDTDADFDPTRLLAKLKAANPVPPPPVDLTWVDRFLARRAAEKQQFEAQLLAEKPGDDDAEPAKLVVPVTPSAELLILDQAAAYLNVTADQVTAFVQDGELRFINVGRGSKRPRYRFTIEDLQEFIQQRKRKEIQCLSTNPRSRLSMPSTFKSEVIGFTARRNVLLAGKPKPSKP